MCAPPTKQTLGLGTPRLLRVPRGACVPRASTSLASVSQVATVREASNILPTCRPADVQSLGRRQELELEAKALLEKDNSWHVGECPPNMVLAESPKQFKHLITSATAGRLVVVDYYASHCNGCRTLYPKLKQIAANNEDCLFIKVNTDSSDMRDLALNLGVTKLPFFQLWRDSEIVASFTANITSISALRAEISTHKHCTDPGCDL